MGHIKPVLCFVVLSGLAPAGFAAAEAKDLLGGDTGDAFAQTRQWNAFFARRSRPATDGPLTEPLRLGPLDVGSDPLGLAGKRSPGGVVPPEGSLIPPDPESDE
jgi:hypothetical protein